MTFVISLGGSILIPEYGKVEVKQVKELLNFLKGIKEKSIIVVGGGTTARIYINAVKELSKEKRDQIGILATKLNATLVAELGNFTLLHPSEITMKRTLMKLKRLKYAVISGWKPGFSTDYVTAYIASKLKESKVINLTRVGGIYTKDPTKYMDARLILRISWEEFLERFNDPWLPGKHVPFDPLAAMLCKKQKMKTYITNVEGFIKWIKEDKFVGTILY